MELTAYSFGGLNSKEICNIRLQLLATVPHSLHTAVCCLLAVKNLMTVCNMEGGQKAEGQAEIQAHVPVK